MYSIHALAFAVLIVVAAKTLAWLLQLRLKNAGLVDPIWAWTLGFLAVFYARVGDAPFALRVLLGLMGGFWGLRLGTHLFVRNWNRPEDWRYALLRKDWGDRANRKLFWFFQFQNIFTLLLSSFAFLPIAFRSDAPPLICWALALLIWSVSVIGEGMADAQMERFRAKPANRGLVCKDGLWRYSRHPNYFFECLHWAAYVPLAIAAPYGWISVLAPIVMALLLMKLSGVPMLEEEMIKRKPAYADYVRDTSALIPWPPRKAAPSRQNAAGPKNP